MTLRRAACAALAAALALAVADPAAAHRLKAFAAVSGGEISGHGFFVGGGRAAHAAVSADGPDGARLFDGPADSEGAFRFPAPAAGPVTIVIDAGDGHAARITLPADRFGPAPQAPAAPASLSDRAAAAPAALAPALEAAVAAAVAREIRPLREALAAAEARLRFDDVAGGVGMIIGMGGAALWALSRRPRP